MKDKFRLVVAALLLASATAIIFSRWDIFPGRKGRPGTATSETAEAASPVVHVPLSPDEENNIHVYDSVSPGVVNITSTVVEYDFFFSPYASQETGSGSILDLEGNVITNYHVIASAENLEVALPDQTKYRATVVGTDKQNDLAVIRLVNVPKQRLHPVPLGDSGALKVGQKVLAIGNPLRLQNTLTTGIISSLGRRIKTESGDLVENVIQTDAAINPGNSGGPLLNTSGEIIGINTSIFTIRGGGNIGIGFAIPANTVRRVVADLIREGRVVRPWLGVEGYQITEELASALNLPVQHGLLVARIYRGSSAETSGMRGGDQVVLLYNERVIVGGDIITEVEGKPIGSREELRLALESKKPGESVHLTIYRGRTKIQKEVLLTEDPRERAKRF
jgi:S1-C subfamily serine protease